MATIELAREACVPAACGEFGSTLAIVFGQRITMLSSTRSKRMMRAGATYGSPGAGPKPPSPVAGTAISMKSWPSCAFETAKETLPLLRMTPINPFVTVAPFTNASYFTGSDAGDAAASLDAAKARRPDVNVKAIIERSPRKRRMQTSTAATLLPTPMKQWHPRRATLLACKFRAEPINAHLGSATENCA